MPRMLHGHKIGGQGSPTFISWTAMRTRCNNPNATSYELYGGRGITVCERWQGSDGFLHFLADMGERPEGMTLDRVDGDGNYEPGNCRWATNGQQGFNRGLGPTQIMVLRLLLLGAKSPREMAGSSSLSEGCARETLRGLYKRSFVSVAGYDRAMRRFGLTDLGRRRIDEICRRDGSVTRVVPASEYDALIDIVKTLIETFCSDESEAIEAIEEGDVQAAEWLHRIVCQGMYSRELFAEA